VQRGSCGGGGGSLRSGTDSHVAATRNAIDDDLGVREGGELQRHASFFWCDSDDDDVDVDICDFVSMLDGVDVC
jgi:hypothetical protein